MADDLVQWTCRNCGERLTMLPKDPGFLRHPNSVKCWSSGNVVRTVDAVRTDEIERLRAEVAENEGVIAVWRRRCHDAERELAALREKIEKAPVFGVHEEPLFGYPGRLVVKTHSLPEDFRGKRVRLLVEEK